MLSKINLKLLIIIWLVIIFILSTLSGNSFDKIPTFKIPHLDKIIHFIMYFVLQFLVLTEYYKKLSEKINYKKFIAISIIISVTYGGIMELLQEFVFTSRTGSFYDFTANSVGAIIGSFALIFIYKKTTLLNIFVPKKN